jgi:glycine dehydrogenase subunit 1
MYDGATATVEAALLARRQTGRKRVIVAGMIHPHILAVLRTYVDPAEVVHVRDTAGLAAPAELKAALGPGAAGVIYQQPNFFGLIENPTALNALAHDAGALAIAVCDPIALALLEPPGSSGADLVVGEAQCLGLPMSFGGPLLGYFAAKRSLLRGLPGRLVAETVDRQGRRGFVLTLQTREQHIRREKATSNICTNQGLMALRATIHMGLLGREGLREVAELCVQKSHHAARLAAAIPGYALSFEAPFFREFVLRCPVEARRVVEAGLEFGVSPGINLGRFRPEWQDLLLVAVTELRDADEIDRWARTLRKAGGAR